MTTRSPASRAHPAGRRRLRGAVIGAALTGLALAAAPAAPAQGALGTNLAAVTYYDGVVPFTDIVDQAGDWIVSPTGSALRARRDGWPARLAAGQTAALPLAEASYPAGRYRVRWRGRGAFTIGDARFVGRSGRGAVVLDGSSLVLLTVRATDPSDPLRDVQVLVPGATRPGFRPGYLATLAPYRALRFMDWQRTNATASDPSPVRTCANRVLPASVSQGQRAGAAVELMVRLANRLDADPWFTVPHDVDESWLRCHARVVARRLEAGRTVRYEFSNETWNPAFSQYGDLAADARAQGLGGGDEFLGIQLETGRRHLRMMEVVRGEFRRAGRTAPVGVLAGQAANAWVLEQRLGTAGGAVDEIAIAPYLHLPGANPYDPGEAAVIARRSPAEVLAELRTALASEVAPWVDDHLALAAQRGVRLVAYEGGQHLAGDQGNAALIALFSAANRDPAMGALYDDYLALWRARTGNALFMHFTDMGPYTRFGAWGALEGFGADPAASPKYAALRRYAAG